MTRDEVKAFYDELMAGPVSSETDDAAVLRWMLGQVLALTEPTNSFPPSGWPP